jgi:hypothetical protein
LPAVGQACEYCLISQGISPLQTQKRRGCAWANAIRASTASTTATTKNPIQASRNNTDDRNFRFFQPVAATHGVHQRAAAPHDGDGELTEGPDVRRNVKTCRATRKALGDVSLLTRYTFSPQPPLDRTTLVAGVKVGVKLPTGNTHQHTIRRISRIHICSSVPGRLTCWSASPSTTRSIDLGVGQRPRIVPERRRNRDQEHRFGNSVNYDVTGKFRLQSGLD